MKFVGPKATAEFDPFSSEYEGWMGNYGNTLERWYHRAAIVLWRKKDRYPMLCEVDPEKVVKELTGLAKRKSTRAEAQGITQNLLPYWHPEKHQKHDVDNVFNKAIFTLALHIDSQPLAQALIEPLGLKVLNAITAKAFAALESVYGARWCIAILNTWAKPKGALHRACSIKPFAQLIEQLASHLPQKSEIIDWLFDYQYKNLKEIHASHKENYSQVKLIQWSAGRIEAFEEVLDGCVVVNKHEFHTCVVNYLIADALLYTPLDLVALLLPLPKDQRTDEQWGYSKLFYYVNTQLSEILKRPLQKEDDWSIKAVARCDCKDCKELSQYLQSSLTQTKIWPLAKMRRQHIHLAIDGMGVPVTHQTKRQGSPHKLILKKTEDLFKQEVHQRKKIKTSLSKLNVPD